MAAEQVSAPRAAHAAQTRGFLPPPRAPLDDAMMRGTHHLGAMRGMPPAPPMFVGFHAGMARGLVAGEIAHPAPLGPTEVVVKNTFLHVADVARPMQRSLSDSDLSSASATFWSHSDSSNASSSSGQDAPGMRSTRARFDPTLDASASAEARNPKSRNARGHSFVPVGPPQDTELRPTQPSFDPTPGGSSSTAARGAQSVQRHAPTAYQLSTEKEEDHSDAASQYDDPQVPDEGDADYPEETIVWSVGSEKHGTGNCTPCMYYQQKKGCRNGRNCAFCHMPHQRKRRTRPCKQKRLMCKQMAEEMFDASRGENSGQMEALRMGMSAPVGSSPPERSYLLKVMAGKAATQERRLGGSDVSMGSSTLQEDVRHQSERLWKMTL